MAGDGDELGGDGLSFNDQVCQHRDYLRERLSELLILLTADTDRLRRLWQELRQVESAISHLQPNPTDPDPV